MAGLERGVRPIGLWSMSMTLSIASRPSIASWAPARSRAPFSSRARARYRTSETSVLLPEPETPVTATKRASGNVTSTFLRLCSRAPRTTSDWPLPAAARRRDRDLAARRADRRR